MNVIIKEEINDLVKIKEEIEEDEEFVSVQENNQDNSSDTDNYQFGEKLLPFEFIKLEPIAEEYQYVKEEYEEVLDLNEQKFYSYVECKREEDKSSDLENDSPGQVVGPCEYKEVTPTERSDDNALVQNMLQTENRTKSKIIIGTTNRIFEKSRRYYSLLRPGRLQNSTNDSILKQPINNATIILQKLNEKAPPPISKFKISLWETAKILFRREQDRKRKALRRAQETEEERNIRRQKDRLARAARRARESSEKKLMRRDRDRKAKALSRAMGLEEKQRRRLSKRNLRENGTKIE